MSQFAYSFSLSLFHSLWQCALLLIFYAAIQPVVKKQLPSFKRNLLYALLFTQVIISFFTFFIYNSGSFNFYSNAINENFSSLLIKQPFIEQLSPWIISLYTAIIFFKCFLLLHNWYCFRRMCKSTLIKPSVDFKLFAFKKANEFGIKRKVTLWFSYAVSTPLTYGFLKPVVLMPVALLNRLSLAEAESLIIHELTHIKNNDYLLNWLLVIVETVFFYNPFVRIIAAKIKLEREKNCDVQVLNFQYPAVSYAETLLKTAKFKTNINFFPLAAVFKNKQLLQRIHFFTSDQNLVFSKKRYNLFSSSLILTALFINIFILSQVKSYNHPGVADEVTTATPQLIPLTGERVPVIGKTAADFVVSSLATETKMAAGKVKGVAGQVNKKDEAVQLPDDQIYEIAAQNSGVGCASPVVNTKIEEKEMIVQEEVSGTGEAIIRAYKVKLKNGKWEDELLYILTEGKPGRIVDSIYTPKDSIMIKYVPAMQ